MAVNMLRPLAGPAFVAAAVLLAGCAADSAEPELSDSAKRGLALMRSNGCAACHGTNGEGGVGPPFVGLFESERQLEDEVEPVIADRDYLTMAIAEPDAQKLAGFRLQMPSNNLSDDEISSVVDYIVELSTTSEEDG